MENVWKSFIHFILVNKSMVMAAWGPQHSNFFLYAYTKILTFCFLNKFIMLI